MELLQTVARYAAGEPESRCPTGRAVVVVTGGPHTGPEDGRSIPTIGAMSAVIVATTPEIATNTGGVVDTGEHVLNFIIWVFHFISFDFWFLNSG